MILIDYCILWVLLIDALSTKNRGKDLSYQFEHLETQSLKHGFYTPIKIILYKKEQITCNQRIWSPSTTRPKYAYTRRISNQSREGRVLLVLPWLIGSALRERERERERESWNVHREGLWYWIDKYFTGSEFLTALKIV